MTAFEDQIYCFSADPRGFVPAKNSDLFHVHSLCTFCLFLGVKAASTTIWKGQSLRMIQIAKLQVATKGMVSLIPRFLYTPLKQLHQEILLWLVIQPYLTGRNTSGCPRDPRRIPDEVQKLLQTPGLRISCVFFLMFQKFPLISFCQFYCLVWSAKKSPFVSHPKDLETLARLCFTGRLLLFLCNRYPTPFFTKWALSRCSGQPRVVAEKAGPPALWPANPAPGNF